MSGINVFLKGIPGSPGALFLKLSHREDSSSQPGKVVSLEPDHAGILTTDS